jgi:hypothetical protein
MASGSRSPQVWLSRAVLMFTLQNHKNAVVRACSDLGVFEFVPQTGEASLKELADKTGADQQLLCGCPGRHTSVLGLTLPEDRFMRTLTATGIFTEVKEEVYSHNALSLVCAGPAKHILKHM